MKNIALTFKRSELLYDIRNTAYTAADVMEDGNGKKQLADIGEDGNIDRVTRILDMEVARCRENLYTYTKREASTMKHNDVLRETDTYVIDLQVPDDFSETTSEYLERLIHEFLVYRVLSEWIGIIDVNDSDRRYPKFILKAENLMNEIHRSLFLKMSGLRRKMSPF